MYQFRGRAYYEEFHERAGEPDFEDAPKIKGEGEKVNNESQNDQGCSNQKA